ncbi:MAG: hypothetical protein GY798_10140 [Hyphomicrobiales bacterium]|nr:hypothetical protein [Hyphomicrobiales bacterium]
MGFVVVASVLIAATAPALAIDDFLDGEVYTPSSADCEKLKAGGIPETFATITSRGLSSYEFTSFHQRDP